MSTTHIYSLPRPKDLIKYILDTMSIFGQWSNMIQIKNFKWIIVVVVVVVVVIVVVVVVVVVVVSSSSSSS